MNDDVAVALLTGMQQSVHDQMIYVLESECARKPLAQSRFDLDLRRIFKFCTAAPIAYRIQEVTANLNIINKKWRSSYTSRYEKKFG